MLVFLYLHISLEMLFFHEDSKADIIIDEFFGY